MSQEPDVVRSSSRRPRIAIWGAVLVVIVWLVVGALGGAAQGKLAGVQSNDNSTFLPKSAESTQVSNAVATFIDSDTLPYLVVVERADGGALTPQDLQAVTTLAQGLPAWRFRRWVREDPRRLPRDRFARRPDPVPGRQGRARLGAADAEKGTEASGDSSALVEGAEAIRDEIESTLVPIGLHGYVGGPGGLIADFAAAFAGIDGILLGVALLVVLVILLIVYRSPILPFAVLISAVFGLSAASLVVYQLALRRRDHAVGPVAGHPVHPRRGRLDRLRPAARQPLQGGAARQAELVRGDRSGPGVGRSSPSSPRPRP